MTATPPPSEFAPLAILPLTMQCYCQWTGNKQIRRPTHIRPSCRCSRRRLGRASGDRTRRNESPRRCGSDSGRRLEKYCHPSFGRESKSQPAKRHIASEIADVNRREPSWPSIVSKLAPGPRMLTASAIANSPCVSKIVSGPSWPKSKRILVRAGRCSSQRSLRATTSCRR